MTVADVAAVVARLSYKPGWSFAAETREPEGACPFLRVSIDVDAVDSRSWPVWKTTRIEHRQYVPLYLFEEPGAVVEYFRRWVIEAETHEAMEFLRLDGALVEDPHR